MTDDEQTRLHQRIDDLLAAPLAVIDGAIAELERLRSALDAELEAHRAHGPMGQPAAQDRASFVERRTSSNGVEPPPTTPERRRAFVSFGEPIGINRQSFQS